MSLDDFIGKEQPKEEMHEFAGDVLDSNDVKQMEIPVIPIPAQGIIETPIQQQYVNQVIHGDCIEKMDAIPSKTVDLIVTDPPYLINYKTNHRQDKKHDFFTPIVGNTQVHQNQKPVDLLMQCIEKHSNEGELVFDGFGGSGSTAIACLKTKRNYLLIEKEEAYVNIIQERIKKVE